MALFNFGKKKDTSYCCGSDCNAESMAKAESAKPYQMQQPARPS